MSSGEVSRYFDATEFRKTREDLIFAVGQVIEPKIAIDCGCGAGADIDYLIREGFTVHGFDIEEESLSRCRARFGDYDNVLLSQSSFLNFEYPEASLVVADASLFFCPPSEFKDVWSSIKSCLFADGLFCGSFLGKEDTMAIPGDNPSVLWPAAGEASVSVFDKHRVLALFDRFEILRFNTHKSSGMTPEGLLHHWHIYQVVARKLL